MNIAGLVLTVVVLSVARTSAAPTFDVTYDESITDSFTGRVYVMLSTSDRREPRFGPTWFSEAPFFALDVHDWKPDTSLAFDDEALWFPVPPSEAPPATYSIQAVMRRNLDSPFVGRGRGTGYSEVITLDLDGSTDVSIRLRIDRIDEARPSPDTRRVKFVRLRSTLLSEFYGRDIVMEAAVILPESYLADESGRYPGLYVIPGFGGSHLEAVAWAGRAAGEHSGRIVKIGLNPLCRTGHHVFADSENNGPRGRALVEELIPHLEREFRLVAAPTARFLTGGSSGGWSSLWLQVTYPDFFGGVWSLAPDPVDFRAFQMVNLYEPGVNMYRDALGARRPIARRGGEIVAWYDEFAAMEVVIGEGGQLYSFDGVFSPHGPAGRPLAFFDRATGEVDPAVIEAWKRYDIRLILQERWATLGPKLVGKLHVIAGGEDDFYLDDAVRLLKQILQELGSDAIVEILPGRTHTGVGSRQMLQRVDRELLEIFDGAGFSAP